MQLIGPIDPRTIPPNGSISMSTGIAARGGYVILHNLSPFDMQIQFDNDITRQSVLFCWMPRGYNFKGRQTDIIVFSLMPIQCTGQTNAPMFQVFGEAFAYGEPVVSVLPQYVRLQDVGNP